MKYLIFFSILLLNQSGIMAQVSSTEYIDNGKTIKCKVENYKTYIFLHIENLGKKTIYIPNLFDVKNSCEEMDCYLSNTLDFYPLVEREIDVIEIEPNKDAGVIYEVFSEEEFGIKEVHISYSCKKMKRGRIIKMIDKVKKAHLLKVK